MHVTEPTKVYFDQTDPMDRVSSYLQYTDSAAEFELKRFTKNNWARQSMDPGAWQDRFRYLKAQTVKSLVFEDGGGKYTHSGLCKQLCDLFHLESLNSVSYPDPDPIPWVSNPHKLRPYQEEIVAKLLAAKHGAVSAATGSGKSNCLLYIAKQLGLKTVIMAPFTNIAEQLYDLFVRHLGSKYVGFYGDGKKQSNKLITIAVAQSLVRVEPGSEDWVRLRSTQVVMFDESHMSPAATMAKVCLGLLKAAPYRFFFSGTQIRNDGSELLLNGIIGPIVYEYSIQDGIQQGYLARPIFRSYQINSTVKKCSDDTMRMQRAHIYDNPQVGKLAAKLANLAVKTLGHSVLILIDEFDQAKHLLPYLEHPAKFAHGGINKDNQGKIPAEHYDPDNKKLVEDFNALKYPILVGTSCISTGTDVKVPKTVIYLKGGRSEIEWGQSLGRGTRRFELDDYKKDSFYFVDIDVVNIPCLHRHAEIRNEYAKRIGIVKQIDLTGGT